MHTRRQGGRAPRNAGLASFPGDNRSFVLLEGEGDNRVETRLTVNWDERKIRLDLTGDRTLLPEKRQHRFFPPYL